MYDDDLFNMLNSYTTTDTEQQTFEDTTNRTQSNSGLYQQTSSPYVDDYTTSQNFEEEKSYNSTMGDAQFEEPQTQRARQMDAPKIIQQTPAVNLIKKREKLYFSARLKIAATIFAIIFAALVFASVWNFAQSGRLQASLAEKETEIYQISQSINELKLEYNELTSTIPNGDAGYVEKVEGENLFTLSLDDFYVEPEIEKLPSNWFNDVCEFFSNLFA